MFTFAEYPKEKKQQLYMAAKNRYGQYFTIGVIADFMVKP